MLDVLAGMDFGSLIAFFFTCFGMTIERRANGKDDNDDTRRSN